MANACKFWEQKVLEEKTVDIFISYETIYKSLMLLVKCGIRALE